jgi:hypothetical protein
LSSFGYVPILGVRPAEMEALEELPLADKDRLLPYIVLQRWSSSNQFVSTTTKVEAAFAGRPIIADLTDEIYSGPSRRPVHDSIDLLRDSSGGYRNWYDFLTGHELYIPSLQLSDPREIASQIPALAGLSRGVVIRLSEPMFGFAEQIANLVRPLAESQQIYFILDFQKQSYDILSKLLISINIASSLRVIIPSCCFSVSASTFPANFVGVTEQEIFERQLHEAVVARIGAANTIYCDRASTRAEKQGGGNGPPAPRIDNALSTKWEFFREPDEDDRELAYQAAASRAILSPNWRDLGIWGTESIKQTAAGGAAAIASSKKSTAARINIHMHIQQGGGVGPSEETWMD